MLTSRYPSQEPRRGAVLLLTAFLSVFLIGMVAFAVDIGWIALVKNQLQVAVDAAAHAGASELGNGQSTALTKALAIAAANNAGAATDSVILKTTDVKFGNWNTVTKSFQEGVQPANAVKVSHTKVLPLFFARVFGQDTANVYAEGIACVGPRDIAFAIDLSGSMNNDTEIWSTAAINGAFSGYPTIGTDIMQDVFNDFNFGTYPGASKHVGAAPGQGTGLSPVGYMTTQLDDNAYLALAKGISGVNVGTGSGIAFLQRPTGESPTLSSTYKIASGDNDTTRKTKAYKFIMDYQLKQLMPNAIPAINSSNTASVNFWTDYLDYVIKAKNSQPVNQDSYQLGSAANPYTDAWPTLTSTSYSGFYNKLGYQTYIQFLMDYGRNKQAGGRLTPLAAAASDCPWHLDNDAGSPGYGLMFPPREQPTHAGRLAIMAAIKEVQAQNVGVDGKMNDHISIVTFDTAAGVAVKYPLQALTMDYEACRQSCRDLQAVADDSYSTATENGLIAAMNHLDPALNTNARTYANKIVILLTDGIPNVKQSSASALTSYVSGNSGVEWFTGGNFKDERNATLMQFSIIKQRGWKGFAVGLGLGCDRDLLDRGARTAGTGIANPDNPTGPKISPYADGNPADYQTRLTKIFKDIIASRAVALVG